ncbi:unnamed protein product [Linum trigynum]|uniref:Galactose oxidase n=1 Tax=Linum trigynum TaxID=586398 RepID=A0AAV2GUG0_9ROSI
MKPLFPPRLLLLLLLSAAVVSAHDAAGPTAAGPDGLDPANLYKALNKDKVLGPHEKFGNPFGNPDDFKGDKLPNDIGTPLFQATDLHEFVGGPAAAPVISPPVDDFLGKFELFTDNSGVCAMHAIVLPNCDHVLMYDATIWRISKILLPNGQCRVLNETTGEKDCYAHSVLLNIKNVELVPLELHTDTWCSSGGLTVDGNLISTGGFQGGANTVRHLDNCPKSVWREYPSALAAPRWYSTQAQLADGRMIVIGGRAAQSFEYIPQQEGTSNTKPFFFDFLQQTTDPDENNLYPFVFLSPDKNVFANNRSVLLNPNTNTVVKEFPVLPGGHRNYPASGMAVLLPLEVKTEDPNEVPDAEVLVCGGSAHIDSYTLASKNMFYEALQDCGRLKITRPNPNWRRELMPTSRVMGDMVILPTGEVLIVNGAQRGASGWGFARDPNLTPVLFNYKSPDKTHLFRELTPTTIPRMYHSTAVVLPEGKVLIAGSNTNNGYIYDAMYPTELRVEKFSPPYFSPSRADKKPKIVDGGCPKTMTYGQQVTIKIELNEKKVFLKNFKVTMYVPAFTTHGVAMNQRLVKLLVKDAVNVGEGRYDVTCMAPPSSAVAPEGYFMLSVVHHMLPTEAVWVQLK